MSKISRILILVCVFLFALFLRECNRSNSLNNKIEALTQDTLRLRNEKGQEILKYKALEVSTKELKDKFKDSLKISNKTKSVTHVITKRVKDYEVKTIVKFDTIVESDTTYLSPVYSGYVGDKYFSAYVEANKDTIKLKPVTITDLFIKFDQKRGLIKSNPIKVTIKNNDPYSSSTAQTYNVVSKKPRLEPLAKVVLFVGGFILGSKF